MSGPHLPAKYFVLHASATYPSMTHVDAAWIRDIHVKQNKWSNIGYHFVIKRDGTVEKGRPIHRVGAHVGGNNTGAIGICLVGGLKEGTKQPEDNYTHEQWDALDYLLNELHVEFPNAKIVGHNFFPQHKTRPCPCFDWRKYAEVKHSRWEGRTFQPTGTWLDEVDVEDPSWVKIVEDHIAR